MKPFLFGAAAALALSTSAFAFAGEFQGEWNGTANFSSGSFKVECRLVNPLAVTHTDTALVIAAVAYDCDQGVELETYAIAFTVQGDQLLIDGQPVGTIAAGKADVLYAVDGEKVGMNLALDAAGTLTYGISGETALGSFRLDHQLKR